MAEVIVADLMVLAIDTLQVAVGKKHIADSICTTDGRFLSLMNADRGNAERGIAFAKAGPAAMPVCIAVSRAKRTIFQILQRIGQGIKIQGRGRFFSYF